MAPRPHSLWWMTPAASPAQGWYRRAIVGRRVGCEVVLRPDHRHAGVGQDRRHAARAAGVEADEPLGPVEVEEVDAGQRLQQPVRPVEQVVGNGTRVDPVAQRTVEALVVPVMGGGRHDPQPGCDRPAKPHPRARRQLHLMDRAQLPVDAAPLGQAVDVHGRHAPDGISLGIDVEPLGGGLGDEDGQRTGRAVEGQLLLDRERASVDAVAGEPAGGQCLGLRAQLPGRPHEPVVRQVEGPGSVFDSLGRATGREALPAPPRHGDEAHERLVGGDVEAARVAGRRRVVRTRPADDRKCEAQAGIPPRPHAHAVAETDPLVPGREDLDR